MPDFFKHTEGAPASQEAAPAYDDVVHLHEPVNGFAGSSGYAAVPQSDIEHDAPIHTHSPASLAHQPPQETLAQTIAGAFRPKPHVHCEECDKQAERRERRENERHCCTMVAWVFMMLFICGMILGIFIAIAAGKRARHHG